MYYFISQIKLLKNKFLILFIPVFSR